MSSFVLLLQLTTIISILEKAYTQTKYTFKGNARCGSTVTGTRSSNEFVYYLWRSSASYDTVYIETCLSDHDTVTYLFSRNGEFIKSADDDNNHPNPSTCNNPYSGDLTIDGTINQDTSYYFGIYGYSAESVGSYSMTLHCRQNNNKPIPSDCSRHRRPWHQLTANERDLYISGFHRLSMMGRMRVFTQTHVQDIAEAQSHGSSAFLPWHRWFIYELESQIRDLGGRWRCFAMPYWDWTYEVSVYGSNVHAFHILNSGLGGQGSAASNYCIMDGVFRRNNYRTFWCDHDESCCLRRNSRRNYLYPNAANMMKRILDYTLYGEDTSITGDITASIDGYRESLEGRPHGVAHVATAGGSQYHLGSMYCPDDPIFYLLHTFIDYQWSLWQDCHDYDLIQSTHLTQNEYVGGLRSISVGGPSGIDDVMLYPHLKDEEWSYLYRNSWEITPRRMHSIHSEYLDYSYEKGSFWETANVDRVCNNINNEWFYNEAHSRISNDIDEFSRISYEMVFGALKTDDAESNDKELFDSWVKLQCEYDAKLISSDCKERPRYFEDCIAMKSKFDGKKDIDITLKDLLNKKGLTECMKRTRILFYDWAKTTYQLYRLCNGDFDAFCDHKLCKDEADQITCLESEEENMQNSNYYSFVLGLIAVIETVVIMYLIYKRNNEYIIYTKQFYEEC